MTVSGPEVCVHGLGHVGLPTAALLADTGCSVAGFDPDEDVRAAIERGDPPVRESDVRALVDRTAGDRFEVVAEPVSASYHLLCVPTGLTDDGQADLGAVRAAGRNVATVLRPGDAVILESTVPPGTTVDVLLPLLASGDVDASEVSVAYSPETVLPGDTLRELRTNERVVGGVGTEAAAVARTLYDRFVESEVRLLPDPTTAEFVKLVQNASRDARIAFANEVARLARDYGVDARRAIELANEHPRVEVLDPGPGVGGHCLPVDPWFLGHGSDALDLVERARAVNDGMSEFVADLVWAGLEDPRDATVALLGVAYKGDVGDPRHSPGLRLATALRERASGSATPTDGEAIADGQGATDRDGSITVRLHDPHVDGARHGIELHPLPTALEDADLVVVVADHDEYRALDPATVGRRVERRRLVDTRGLVDAEAWTRAGFEVEVL